MPAAKNPNSGGATMRAMVLHEPGQKLRLLQVERPAPDEGQVLVRVRACAVCRTDLHVADGELSHPKLPLILGHEIVGRVEQVGPGVRSPGIGDRVGIPWLGWTCGACEYCVSGRENLCPQARFTGYTLDGGFAEYVVADARYCLPLPEVSPTDAESAPWLCAGLIGYRSLRKTGDAHRLGLYGFGAAAHIVAQVAIHQGREVFAFTRPGDLAAQSFAQSLGATWAGDSQQPPPTPLDAAIIFAPVGALVPQALEAVAPGGIVVCGGIHMSDVPSFSYKLLWGERSVVSVANLTRQDGEDFLAIAARIPVKTAIQRFPLAAANEALAALRNGQLTGAAVLEIE